MSVLPVGFGSAVAGGFQIERSLRFNSADSAYLNRTPASAGNRKTWTFSFWFKRGLISDNVIFGSRNASVTTVGYIGFQSDKFDFQFGATGNRIQDAAVRRDPGAWAHYVVVCNTTSATSTDRMQLWVNGVRVTTFTTTSYPTQNADSDFNVADVHAIGRYGAQAAQYVDGYLTEVNFIDGQALTPSSFGETNSNTGVWQPIKYTGTYGTNGFYLNFSDNSSNTATTIGKDYSGNGNNWTPNNISVTAGSTYDSMTDVPTLTSATAANYCVMNPLFKFSYTGSNAGTFSDGNLKVATGGNPTQFAGTLELCDGAYYEITAVSIDVNRSYIGLFSPSLSNLTTNTSAVAYNATYNVLYSNNGEVFVNTSSGSNLFGTVSSWTNGSVISVAYKAGKIYLAKDGVWQNSGVPASGTGFVASGWDAYGALLPYCGYNSTFSANFGQQPFIYTPPTGFVALNTYNL